MKLKQTIISFCLVVGIVPFQGQELLAKAIMKLEPSLKTMYERLNQSNGEKAELIFRMVSDSSEHSLLEYKGKVVIVIKLASVSRNNYAHISNKNNVF